MSWLYSLCAYAAIFTALMYVGCKLRLLPPAVMRFWWIFLLIVNILTMGFLTLVVDSLRYAGVPRAITQKICVFICWWTFWLPSGLAPHITLRFDPASELRWADVPDRTIMALNHVSFYDAFLFTGSAPWSYIQNTRCMMKDSLKKLPIFGKIFDRVGHFPVYFKSNEDGNFSLDKERQAKVMEKVKVHIDKGGRLALFPEGAVNKTPATLQTFRHGMFAMVLENKLPLYYFVTVGNDETWPAKEAVGGFPADIEVFIGKYPIDFSRTDLTPQMLAEGLQKVMQSRLDEMRARRNRKRD